MPHLRPLLILGRASNLPTIWSNTLAAYLIAGGALTQPTLIPLLIAATLLYLAGMYLNDAFDAQHDQQHQPQRPIPAGHITQRAVLLIGITQLTLGALTLTLLAKAPIQLTLPLTAAILIYNARHKNNPYAPILMALCRLLLYLAAAATAPNHINHTTILNALTLAAYIIALTHIARQETKPNNRPTTLPTLLLAAPILTPLLTTAPTNLLPKLIPITLYTTWTLHALHKTYRTKPPKTQLTVSRLLAGIILLDLIAITPANPPQTILILLLLPTALLLQKHIPPT